MPTGFSPNGDGINDELLVRGRGVDYINLKIFDRIGEKVFETSDLDKGWDGRLLGVPMNDNVFVYMLEVTFCNGETVKEKGNVTLVK
jgi:gliding motility-associated-like protein